MDNGVLDAKARRELADLRRRAYGPESDILSDPAAVTRLESLERRAHATAPTHTSADRGGDAAARSGAPARHGTLILAARPAWHVALIAGCGAVALALGTFAAIAAVRRGTVSVSPAATAPGTPLEVREFTRATTTRLLARLPLEDTLRGAVEPSGPDDVPLFPTDDPLLWVDPLGQYFGMRLWIAKTVTGGSCVLAELAIHDRGACVDGEVFAASALLVTVPFGDLADGTRPTEMTAQESFGIWWRPDRPIELLIGPTPGLP